MRYILLQHSMDKKFLIQDKVKNKETQWVYLKGIQDSDYIFCDELLPYDETSTIRTKVFEFDDLSKIKDIKENYPEYFI